MTGGDFTVDGWDDFANGFSKLLDDWEEQKQRLLEQLGAAMMMYILPLVPVDTSRLVSSFSMRVNGSECVEVFTNVEYALYVDEGHLTKADSFVPGVHYIDRGMAEARPHIENILNDFVNKMMGRIF